MSTQVILKITPSELDILREALDQMLANRKAAYEEVPINLRSRFGEATTKIQLLRNSL